MQQEPQNEADATYYQPVDTPTEQQAPVVDGPAQLPQVEPVHWQAAEYSQATRTPLWYVLFAIVVAGLMAAAIFLMQAWTFAILIPVMAGALMVYLHRPANQLSYTLSEKGLYINDQLHPLEEFKSFGVLQSIPLNSLTLIPVKRFKPGLTVFFPTEVGEQIVDVLGGYLPMQDIKLDAFDAILRKLHI